MLIKSFYRETSTSLDCLMITHEIRRVLQETSFSSGLLTVLIPFPGASLLIAGSAEKQTDLKKTLEPLVKDGLLSYLLPKVVSLPFEGKKLAIEPWQDVFLIDYDKSGKRREFRVHTVSSDAPAAPTPKEGF